MEEELERLRDLVKTDPPRKKSRRSVSKRGGAGRRTGFGPSMVYWIIMKIRTIIFALVLLSFFTVLAGGYLYYSSLKRSEVSEVSRDADTMIKTFAERIDLNLLNHQKMTKGFAVAVELQEALRHRSPESAAKANAVLDYFQDGFHADVCYLMDRAGNTIASSNRNSPDSFVGKNYAFRPYFRQAIEGVPAVYMAVGVTSKKQGIYYSQPVYRAGQKAPIGVVVMKTSIEYLQDVINRYSDGAALLAGPSGVIFLSNRGDLPGRLIWKVSPEVISMLEKDQQFGKGPFAWSGFERKSQDRAVDEKGNEYFIHEAGIDKCPGWKIFFLRDIKKITDKISGEMLRSFGYFMLAFSVLFCITLGFLYAMANKEILARKRVDAELRKSEERYRGLFESCLDGVYQTDADGIFRMMNQAGAEMFGHKNPSEIIGTPVLKYWRDPKDREAFTEELKTRKKVSVYHMSARKITGEKIELESTSRIIEDEHNKFLGIEGILRDVTRKMRLEEELLISRKFESLGILVKGIAHDFNNLLNAILGNISFAKAYLKPGDRMFDILEEAEKGSMKAAELVSRLAQLAETDGPLKKTLAVSDLIKDSSCLLADDRNHRCKYVFPEDLWEIDADEIQMRQVFEAILSNAFEAMPEGGTVEVIAENITMAPEVAVPLEKGRYVRLSVRDNGPGIPQDVLSKIFDPYFTTKKAWGQRGLGLGLAACYSIIKNHKGLLTVESDVGAGTTFTIYLPAHNSAY